MALDPLTPSGVADVLTRMAFPLDRLGARVDIVSELHRLSGGDPLLVRLYTMELWTRGEAAVSLQPEDLCHIQPGLDGFFSRWWDDQRRLWGKQAPLREPAVQTLLNIFACALGPLFLNDLSQLAPPEANLNMWTLEDVLRPLNRFVIGDGFSQGYAFTHPRLSDYFYNRLQLAEQAQDQEMCFVHWGNKTLTSINAGELKPADVSSYIIQYYRPHLERTGCGIDAMQHLVNENWLKAWYKIDKGSYAGFLNDSIHVWRAADRADALAIESRENPPYLDVEIRSAFCRSSVSSLAGDIPLKLLMTLIETQVWTPAQAFAYAVKIPDTELRIQTLIELAQQVQAPQSQQMLAGALSAVKNHQERPCACQGDEDTKRVLAGGTVKRNAEHCA